MVINSIKGSNNKININIKPILKGLFFKIFYIKLAFNKVNYNNKININIKLIINNLSLKEALIIII